MALERLAAREESPAAREFIPWARPDFWGNEHQYVAQALESSWISGGPFVERLERDFAQYQGMRSATTTSNGTTALHLAFLALDIGPGDEVIVPGFAFQAAANVALHLGAKPVFTEVDPATWCMTAEGVRDHLSPRTKAIVPVHTYGNLCAVEEIVEMAKSRPIWVIEDAAEAFGSRNRNRLAGTTGVMGTFSFHATKTITTGEGGMVVTDDPDLKDRMRLFRSHGMLHTRYYHQVAGHNFRLTNLQAALGCAQLEKIDRITQERKRVFQTYKNFLSKIPGVTMQFFLPQIVPVVWAIAVLLDPGAYPQGRDLVIQQLREGGIETRNGFHAASEMRHLYSCSDLPICENLSRQVISLPTYARLKDGDIEMICASLGRLRK